MSNSDLKSRGLGNGALLPPNDPHLNLSLFPHVEVLLA